MISQKAAEEILKRSIEPDIVLSSSPLGYNQWVYMPAHPEYHSRFKPKDYLYALVHPGYIVNGQGEFDDFFLNDIEYKTYLNNIEWLIRKLRENNEPIMLVLDKDVFLGKKTTDKKFYPINRELLLITEPGDPWLSDRIDTPYGGVEIDPELIYSFLKKVGVRELRFAGELAGEEGCLKYIAKGFHGHKFRVRGVKDCIFPAIPFKKDDEILKMLYDDAFAPEF